MEVVQGKSTDKKIVIAQEIAFAKVLSGNNKTLRDRALKKLKKWLTVRGSGNWAFTEDEFIRIWTGLFYCMWMSDKFLVQEELAENISKLIHCFKKSSENALLFIKCFNKRILMEWEGLDQYRVDKFNMLIRRFLRQTFEYCKEKEWDKSILLKLTDIFYNIVLHRDNSLGFILHFINIYPEELAKVSKGKLENETVLTLIEPFVKLISRTKEQRIMSEAEEFFNYLMRQTDVGIEFEEKFNEWKKLGFPGRGPESLQKVEFENGFPDSDEESNDDDDEDVINEPLDPRAGSVHVFLPQITFETDSVIALLKKYEKAKPTTSKGRKKLKALSMKFEILKKGKFPENVKKDPILDENTKKKRLAKKNAKLLLDFTKNLDKGPVKTPELKGLEKELEQQNDDEESDNNLNEENNDSEEEMEERKNDGNDHDDDNDDDITIKHTKTKKRFQEPSNDVKGKQKSKKKIKINENIVNENENNEVRKKKKSKRRRKKKENKDIENQVEEEKVSPLNNKKHESLLKSIESKVSPKGNSEEAVKPAKKRQSLVSLNPLATKESTPIKKEKSEVKIKSSKKRASLNGVISDDDNSTPKRSGMKRKILSNWQVQELDTASPEYYKIKTPNVIRMEIKQDDGLSLEENQQPKRMEEIEEKNGNVEKEKIEIIPAFWSKAIAKSSTKKSRKSDVFVNPFSETNGDSKSSGLRRISFALEKNMAQENAEYLEEVKNSPKVPFDGSRKPIQSALKSGLSPSPINPFYRFKKIKLA